MVFINVARKTRSAVHKMLPFATTKTMALAGFAIVALSFFFTLKIMDYFDAWRSQVRETAAVSLHPLSWTRSGPARYEQRDGNEFIFFGPDAIFEDLPCGKVVGSIAAFSAFVKHAAVASIQLQFINTESGAVAQPIVEDISGTNNRLVEVTGRTGPGVNAIRGVLQSPRGGEEAVFRDAVISCKPPN